MKNENGDTIRLYGETDGKILEAIGKAMQHPGKNIIIHDLILSHVIHNGKMLILLQNRVEMFISKLSLERMKLLIEDGDLHIRSEFYGTIDPKPGTGKTWKLDSATKEDWKVDKREVI